MDLAVNKGGLQKLRIQSDLTRKLRRLFRLFRYKKAPRYSCIGKTQYTLYE